MVQTAILFSFLWGVETGGGRQATQDIQRRTIRSWPNVYGITCFCFHYFLSILKFLEHRNSCIFKTSMNRQA